MRFPLLSICIPTYNRAEYLKKTLDSIIYQKGFDERVEIVISDNCSTDITEQVCREYVERFSNIKYYKNKENISDRNFPTVLSKADGILRKLSNDTNLFNEGSLDYLLEIVKEWQSEKPVIFTNNKGKVDIKTEGLESFLRSVSFNITWIGGVCVWGDDFEFTEEGCTEKLWQVSFLLRYVAEKKKVFIANKHLFTTQIVEKKNISYGLYKVFYVNYLEFVKKYLETGELPQSCYEWLERDLLFNFFPVWMINYEKQNKQLLYSQDEDLVACVKNAYRGKSYYLLFCWKYGILKIKTFCRNIYITYFKHAF